VLGTRTCSATRLPKNFPSTYYELVNLQKGQVIVLLKILRVKLKIKTFPGKISCQALRQYPGLQHLSDSQAQEAIDALEKLSLLLFQIFKNGDLDKYGKGTIV
jgi:hypothetical protein